MSIKLNNDLIESEFIELCYKLAENALELGEVPVGCVFVLISGEDGSGQVLAVGHNRTNESRNATRHAEIECIDIIVEKFGPKFEDLYEVMSKTTVLLTLEPCLMCVRALRALRVKQVLFGAKNDRFGGSDSVHSFSTDERIDDPMLNCHQLLDNDKSIALLQQFYQQTNESAPKPKPKKLKT